MKKVIVYFLSSFLLIFIFSACNNETSKTETPMVLSSSSQSGEAKTTFDQGLAMLDQGDFQQSHAMFVKALQQDPKMAIAYVFKAATDASPKEFTDDMNKAKENLAGVSEFEKIYYDYSATFIDGDWNKRLELAQKMATSFPKAARAQVELGNTYLNGNENAKARESYQKAVELDPKWVGGYAALVNSYLFSEPKDFKKAEENALKVVEMAPTSPGAEIALGDCYRAQNDLQKAREAYSKAIQLNPNSSEAYYKKGHANSFLGNFDEARQNYTDGGKHDDVKFAEVTNIANTYLYAGDNKMAMQYLMDACGKMDASGETKDRIAILKANCLDACTNISMYYGDGAKVKEMVAMLNPVNAEITNQVGTEQAKLNQKAGEFYWEAILNAMNGDYNGAKTKAEEIKTTVASLNDPNKLNGYEFAMGYINMKEKKYTDAISHFEKTHPENSVFNKYWLAMANEAAGNKDKAKTLYMEVADYNFNEIGYALIRNDVKKKLAMP
jgi:tetratricopeptide (TPR) repeat protein